MLRSAFRPLFSVVLLVAPSLPAAAQPLAEGEAALERVLAESADTPAEHQALARHYRARAAKAREKAESHRWMAAHYGGSLKPAIAAEQRQHCEQLARGYGDQAEVFDQLATGHEEAVAE